MGIQLYIERSMRKSAELLHETKTEKTTLDIVLTLDHLFAILKLYRNTLTIIKNNIYYLLN